MEQETNMADAVRSGMNRSDQPAGTYRIPTPGYLHAARIIMIVHGALVLVSGIYLVRADDIAIPSALAWVSVVEGGLRVIVASLFRRGANALRVAALVLCGIGVIGGFMAGGLGILLSAAPNLIVLRCLIHEDTKEWFGTDNWS
jgi:hypothetical protein